jgi:hypothetical protein
MKNDGEENIQMRMNLVFAILLSANLAFGRCDGSPGEAHGSAEAAEKSSLDTTGFKILERNETLLKIQFRDDAPLIISKARFTSIKQAEAFCTERKLQLHHNGITVAFLIAISGAPNFDDEFKSAISYELRLENSFEDGIWAWQGPEDKLIVMPNGRGTSTELIDVPKFREAVERNGTTPMTFAPAICIEE